MRKGLFAALALTLGAYALPSSAGLISTSANVTEIAAPSNVTNATTNPAPSDDTILIFQELDDFMLPNTINLNLLPGQSHMTTNAASPEPIPGGFGGTLNAGTIVDVYFVHYNGLDDATTAQALGASATFGDDEVLGVMGLFGDMHAFDADAFPTTGITYPTGQNTRGVWDSNVDSIDVAVAAGQVSFNLATGNGFVDQLRIFVTPGTPGPIPMPEPSSLPLLVLGALMLGLTRRLTRRQ